MVYTRGIIVETLGRDAGYWRNGGCWRKSGYWRNGGYWRKNGGYCSLIRTNPKHIYFNMLLKDNFTHLKTFSGTNGRMCRKLTLLFSTNSIIVNFRLIMDITLQMNIDNYDWAK